MASAKSGKAKKLPKSTKVEELGANWNMLALAKDGTLWAAKLNKATEWEIHITYIKQYLNFRIHCEDLLLEDAWEQLGDFFYMKRK